MIQVNLLPGAGGRSQSRSDFNLAGMFATATAGVRDKFLVGSVGTTAAVVLTAGFLFIGQNARERTLVDREVRAVEDSARYKVVLAAKAKAEATRDSLYHQVAIIKSIDDSRFLWPHLLEEISNALPQYTWLTTVTQTSAPPSSVAADTVKKSTAATGDKKDDAKEKNAKADSVLAAASRSTRFRIVGHTVDIQALTLFMKTLEASPFIQNVQLTRSDLVLVDTKEVTEFQLEAESQKPPPSLVRTVSMSVEGN
ncbi:MAG TPA: PilN domain-containing protein [Gemmatimonadaceae bacterium]|nr:PilN domain-containing protein [Gemmatimonadaceae bacterium]